MLEKFPASGSAKVYKEFAPKGFPNHTQKAPKDPQIEPKSFPNGGQWRVLGGLGHRLASSRAVWCDFGTLWAAWGATLGAERGPTGAQEAAKRTPRGALRGQLEVSRASLKTLLHKKNEKS